MSPSLRIPVVSIIPGIGAAIRQQLAAAGTGQARELFQAGELQVVDVPLPQLAAQVDPAAAAAATDEDAVAPAPTWELSPDQQQMLEDAEIIFMDAHLAAPLLFAGKQNLPLELHHLLKKVKWVQGTYAGVDVYMQHVDKQNLPSFTVTRAGGIMPTALAQFVFGWAIAIERKFFEARALQEQRQFARWQLKYRSYSQLTVGILGLGEIGQEIGRTFKSAGFQVIGFKRRLSPEDDVTFKGKADRVTNNMRDVLVSSDYIVNVLPSTPATRYLLNKDSLAVCATKKPVFINVGRGDVISEDEIISALDNEIFSKAVLDVFETEPLPQESKLWDHPLVTVTPHISGSVFPEDVAAVMIQNLDRKLAGQPLEYQVDWANGY